MWRSCPRAQQNGGGLGARRRMCDWWVWVRDWEEGWGLRPGPDVLWVERDLADRAEVELGVVPVRAVGELGGDVEDASVAVAGEVDGDGVAVELERTAEDAVAPGLGAGGVDVETVEDKAAVVGEIEREGGLGGGGQRGGEQHCAGDGAGEEVATDGAKHGLHECGALLFVIDPRDSRVDMHVSVGGRQMFSCQLNATLKTGPMGGRVITYAARTKAAGGERGVVEGQAAGRRPRWRLMVSWSSAMLRGLA